MVTRLIPLALSFAVFFGPYEALAEDEPMSPHPSWIEGCWQNANGSTQEVWVRGYDGLLFGHSITMRDEKLRAFEDMRIQRQGGGFMFSASPNGRTPVLFLSTDQSETSLTFENPEHDFPQRIRYERSKDGLIATISDLQNEKHVEFAMIGCDANRE